MTTIAAGLDMRELNKRIAETDRSIAAKEEALNGRLEQIQADGKELHQLPAAEMAELTAARLEVDGMKDERKALADAGMAFAGRHAAARPADPVSGSFHERLVGSMDKAAIISGGINTPSLEVLDRDGLVAALGGGRRIFGAATAVIDAGIPLDERLYPTVETRRRTPRLLDLVTVGATNSDTVVYSRQTTRTSAAAETALGTAYSEASFDFEQVTAAVKSIGHFTTAYRENIADAAQFDTLVRAQLEEDVLLRLESQILVGDGTGSTLTGILETGSIGSLDHDATNDRRVMSIHRAMTTVRTGAFREPDAVLMHPNDYQEMIFEEINLSGVAGAAMAFVPDLTGRTPGTVWGLPIVVSTVATEGTAVVGYWKEATLWVREGVSLRVSDSHSDYFTRRQVAILADMRGAFSVQRPASFCEITTI
jgi:HK97 family phage major capsid protein